MANPSPQVAPPVPSLESGPASGAESNRPAEVGTWQDAIAGIGGDSPSTPESKPSVETPPAKAPAAPTPKPLDQPAKAPDQPQAKPEAKAEPDAGRKARLDPDELLNVEGVDSAELPENVVQALTKLDARDLRLQSAKLAKTLRTLALKSKEQEKELATARAPKDDPEKKALQEERDTLRKRHEDMEREIRYSNYVKSNEYKEKFETPFVESLDEAYEFVEQLTVTTDEGVRRATKEDFNALLNMEPQAAAEKAEEMFGRLSNRVLNFQDKLASMQRAARKAVDNYKKEGDKVERERLVKTEEQRKAIGETWKRANEEIQIKFPELFGEVEGDDEGNTKLRDGYAEVDRAQDPNISLQERIGRTAAVRHRAAALPREVYRRKKAEKENAELREIIKNYEASVPGKGLKDGAKPPAVDDETDAASAIDRISV